MSTRGLAARVGYARSYLHDLESGRKRGSRAVVQRLDDALAAEGELLRIWLADADLSPTAAGLGHTGSVQRRTLIARAATIVAAESAAGWLPAVIAALTDRGRAYTSPAGWDELVWEYGFAYLSSSRAALVADLTADLAALLKQVDVADGRQRYSLCASGGRLATLLAMACDDLGDGYEARSGWRLARSLADASQSPETQAWVRGQEATLGLYSNRPLTVILGLTERGLLADNGSHKPSPGAAALLAAKAQALAWIGHEVGAADALAELQRLFDRLPDEVTSLSESIAGFPAHRMLHAETFVRSMSGTTAAATAAHEQALTSLPAERTISRCQLELHLAVRHVRDGNIDEGMGRAAQAMEQLPRHQRGRLVLAVAERVVRSVPAGARAHPAVEDLSELVVNIGRR
jgi:hypothetical protein